MELWPKLKKDLGLSPIKHQRRKKMPPINVIVGADPEFEAVLPDGTIVSANRYVDGRTSSPIGVDGAGDQVELRPEPGNPREVVNNLRSLFEEFATLYNMHLSVEGDNYPLGGHIHIGVGKEFCPTSDLLGLLDDFLGKPMLEHSGFARGCYKALGTYEPKPWGFEYRPLPASFFLKPEITRIVLKVAHNLVYRYVNGSKNMKYNCPPQKKDYLRLAKLTEREYGVLRDFIEGYCKIKNRFATSFWLNGKIELKHHVRIEFRDDWNEAIRKDIKDYLTAALKKKKLKRGYVISLYGLREDRGPVATIPGIKGVELIEDNNLPHGLMGSCLYIGLPYYHRTDVERYSSQRNNIISAIVAEVERVIN